jgi:large subunit ribosomal protein L35
LPFGRSSAISPIFIARLIKGCRGGDPCEFVPARNNRALSTLWRAFQPRNRLLGRLFPWQEESQMPKLKTKSGAKKRFKVTGTGKVVSAHAGKRHGMIKRTKKQIRQLRGTRILFKTDGDNIKKYFLPNA